jgi:hypothetical protein
VQVGRAVKLALRLCAGAACPVCGGPRARAHGRAFLRASYGLGPERAVPVVVARRSLRRNASAAPAKLRTSQLWARITFARCGPESPRDTRYSGERDSTRCQMQKSTAWKCHVAPPNQSCKLQNSSFPDRSRETPIERRHAGTDVRVSRSNCSQGIAFDRFTLSAMPCGLADGWLHPSSASQLALLCNSFVLLVQISDPIFELSVVAQRKARSRSGRATFIFTFGLG